MSWLESLGLLGLFIGTFLAATIVPFSSDALYIAVLVATKNPVACLIVGTLGNWLGSVTTYWIGRIGKWEWIEKKFKVKPETLERQKQKVDCVPAFPRVEFSHSFADISINSMISSINKFLEPGPQQTYCRSI